MSERRKNIIQIGFVHVFFLEEMLVFGMDGWKFGCLNQCHTVTHAGMELTAILLSLLPKCLG